MMELGTSTKQVFQSSKSWGHRRRWASHVPYTRRHRLTRIENWLPAGPKA